MTDAIEAFVDALAHQLERSDFHDGCPVGVTTMETGAASDQLAQATAAAFDLWVSAVERRLHQNHVPDASDRATTVIAAIEGGVMLARANRNVAPLRAISRSLAQLVPRPTELLPTNHAALLSVATLYAGAPIGGNDMIDHASIPVRDLQLSTRFYERVLAPLGMAKLVDREGSIGFGKRYPELWLNLRVGRQPSPSGDGAHICLRARDEDAVRRFFEVALSKGSVSAGEPGLRQAALTDYYCAFIEDLDGHRIEAATFPLAPTGGFVKELTDDALKG